MATRAEMLRRHDLAEEARKRVRSGQYNQPQEVEPYKNPRAAALAAYKPPESGHTPEPIDIVQPGQSFNPLQGTMDRVKSIAASAQPAKKAQEQKSAADYIAQGKATRDAQDPKNPILRAIKNNTVDLLGEGIDRALVNTGLGRVANRFSQSAGNAVGVDTQAAGAAPLLSTGSKFVDKTADIAGALGGMAVNPAALEQGLIQGGYGVANRLTSRLSEGLGKRAATGAIAGAIQNSALSGVQGKTTAKDIGLAAAEGAVLGGVGDPLLHGLGSAAGKLLKRNVVPAAETQAKEVLSLPMGREDAARMRSINAPGTEPIVNPYTFKLNQGTDNSANIAGTRNDLKSIDDEIRQMNGQYDKAIVDEYNYLKSSMDDRDGVQQGGLISDISGNVTGRYGRQSNNPLWYQEFYRANGKMPSNKELYALAKDRIDNGFKDEMGDVPSWKAQNNFDETMNALNGVRTQINDSLREVDPALTLTDARLKDNVLNFNQVRGSEPSTAGAVDNAIPDAPQSTRAQALAKHDAAQAATPAKPVHPEVARLDQEFNKYKENINKSVRNGIRTSDEAARAIKGHAMRISAEKRVIIQGELLIPVDGGLTAKELQNKISRLKSNYTGKEVFAGGREGKIKGNSFGKVMVEFPDGSTKSYDPSEVTPKKDIDELIKNQTKSKTAENPAHNSNQPVRSPAPQSTMSTRQDMLAQAQTASSAEAPPVMKQRGLVGNLERSGKLDDETMGAIKKNPEANYEPIRNADTVAAANARVSRDTLESEKGYIMNKGGKGDFLSTEDIATGFRLLDEYKALGDVESASQIALKLAQTGTRNGQAVQINAIYSRLTPQGVLRVASKVFNEGVDDIAKQKPLPPELTRQITDAAEAMQKASGSESLSKAAITIFEKARSGQALDEREIATLKRFATEAKKLLPAEKAPRAPRAPREPNTRAVDKVKAASSSAAEKARARIAARRNRLSANPLDEWADYAIVGFDHMMTGAVKIADFSSKMRQEFGDGVDSVMDKIYVNAYGKYRRANKIPASQFETMTNKALAGEKISEADADSLRVMAIELSQLEGAAKNEAAADLQEAFNAMKNGTPGKKAASVLRSVQLGNARTILRNEISNNAFYMLDTVRRKWVATPFDVVASAITGKNREIFFKNGPQAWNQYFKDWGTGYKMGKRGLNPGGLQSQYDLGSLAFNPKSTNVIEKVGSFMERNVGAFMKAGDYAAANRAISNEMGQLAQAKAYAEGLRGKELARKAEEYFHTADSKMAEQAQKYGEYMTFQDKNFLSDAAVDLRDRVLNVKKDFGLGNVVINYPKTPANILMRAVDYSPLGFVKFMGQIGRAAVKKDVTKKEFIDTFTRALAGTGIAGIGLYLSKLGMLNVLPSKDIGVSELERKAGKIPNSLNITALKRYVLSFGDESAAKPKQGDTYASVDWFQPLAIPASVGAAAGQSGSATRLNTGINAADAGMQSLDAALESFGNMSVYRNIKDLVGNSYSTPSQKAGKLAANAATMFTPAILGQVRNVVDPYTRDTGTKSGFVGQVKGQLMNRIPGLSSKLPKSVDTFGDEKKSDYGTGTRALNAFLNPSLVDQYTPTPEAKEVLDLIERTGQKTLAPNKPQRSMTYKKETYGFNQEQYREYQKLTGKFVTENLRKSQSYLDNPAKTDAQRIKKVSDEITDAGDKAKKEMRKQMGIK